MGKFFGGEHLACPAGKTCTEPTQSIPALVLGILQNCL
jgi:hypothetical protein